MFVTLLTFATFDVDELLSLAKIIVSIFVLMTYSYRHTIHALVCQIS